MRRLLLLSCPFVLAGCAVTSFAPPIVKMDRELTFTRAQTSFNAVCTPNFNDPNAQSIRRDTDGALLLINNFVLTYRCQSDRASEGRQFFEVPSFLSTAGGAAAAAFGAPAGIAIGTGAASAALTQGKSYYAPKDKAVVFNDALDAFLCIQNEAVGIDPFTLKKLAAAQEAAGAGADTGSGAERAPGVAAAAVDDDGGPQVYVSSERQYFEMVRTALFAVERVTAQRLSAAGSPFDASGVIAELEKLNKEEAEDEAAAPDPATAGQEAKEAVSAAAPAVTPAGVNGPPAPAPQLLNLTAAQRNLAVTPNAQLGRTVIKLRALQPKLDKCILRAKV
ncbi:MAG: hypothetical protein M3Q19_08550 [Pseudomonadota bacterium]|nr:hypothetical protein [Pseudomonadota bacterium]